MGKKTILYLRTDLTYNELIAGGSVGHTVGVIQGFIDNGFDVVCVSTCMVEQLKKLFLKDFVFVPKPPLFRFLRWRLGCLAQAVMSILYAKELLNKYQITALYQRYTVLNFTGIFLAWWYEKKLILEYNGSEYWLIRNWNKDGRIWWLLGTIKRIELLNLRRSDNIIVVSDVLKEELVGRGIQENKILVNPNGVNEKQFSSNRFKNVKKSSNAKNSYYTA